MEKTPRFQDYASVRVEERQIKVFQYNKRISRPCRLIGTAIDDNRVLWGMWQWLSSRTYKPTGKSWVFCNILIYGPHA